jgi:hypothetical protein
MGSITVTRSSTVVVVRIRRRIPPPPALSDRNRLWVWVSLLVKILVDLLFCTTTVLRSSFFAAWGRPAPFFLVKAQFPDLVFDVLELFVELQLLLFKSVSVHLG